ncbi:hypothetical protein ACFV1N_48585 [Streptosporangium canum]|uniref:hypothetical protein n=1 Tax=Streptosporangium canum TaxID=324952 RepID=UPI003699CD0A
MSVEGLAVYAEALGELDEGRVVDVVAVRARLVHEADQLRALSSQMTERGMEYADAGERMAGLMDRLLSGVVHLENGDAPAGRAAMVEAMTASFGRGKGKR